MKNTNQVKAKQWIFAKGGECKECHREGMTELNVNSVCFECWVQDHNSRVAKEQVIRGLAFNWHNPINDFKNFNKHLMENYDMQTQRRTVARLLGYT